MYYSNYCKHIQTLLNFQCQLEPVYRNRFPGNQPVLWLIWA